MGNYHFNNSVVIVNVLISIYCYDEYRFEHLKCKLLLSSYKVNYLNYVVLPLLLLLFEPYITF